MECMHLYFGGVVLCSHPLRFLLACLYTNSLSDKRTTKEVKSALYLFETDSTSLDNAYRETIRRVESQPSGDVELAKNIISWITLARRPLTCDELRSALAVEPGTTELDPEALLGIEDLAAVCGGLVIVDGESNIVRLVHYTAQQHFESLMTAWNPAAHWNIALTCLTYLCFDVFKTGPCVSDEDLEERMQENGFLDYAAKIWGEHVLPVEEDMVHLTCSFIRHEELLLSATQVLYAPDFQYPGYSQNYPRRTTPLHIAARFGLFRTSKTTMMESQDISLVDAADSYGYTPLAVAASHNNFTVAGVCIKSPHKCGAIF